MEEQLHELRDKTLANIKAASTMDDLEKIRVATFGKNSGALTELLKKLPELSAVDKGPVGKTANAVKLAIEQALASRQEELTNSRDASIAETEWIDVTIPGQLTPHGHLHAQTQVLHEVLEIFQTLGYQVADGFEIESDYYNFTALNMPPHAPSRDTQSTFYLDPRGSKVKAGEIITRTQLSGMQVRIMEKTKPPMRVVIPGKVYRVDDVDASHGFEFWQLEGMLIDKKVKFTDLLGTMEYVLKKLYSQDQKIRFDCTNFAFVEPGVQAYMSCTICKQRGCPFCKHTGWVEIMPAGMVHPSVIRAGGLDPKEWNGFAFCVGLSRAVVLKYQIDDLRVLTNPDLRILRQF